MKKIRSSPLLINKMPNFRKARKKRTHNKGDRKRIPFKGVWKRTRYKGDRIRAHYEGDRKRTHHKGDRKRANYEGDQKRTHYEGDRISQLPDEILIQVLSLLSLREAVLTSILSRRWLYLWTFIPRLDFNAAMAPSISKTNEQKRVDSVSSVIRLMERVPNNIYLEEFRVHLNLDRISQHAVDSWFQFALSKRVRKLDFDFADDFGYLTNIQHPCKIHHPCKISLEFLSQMGGMLMFEHPKPSMSQINNAFVRLKCLRLRNVIATPDVMHLLLLKCEVLESLSLYEILCLTHLIVSGPSLKLKYLDIAYCPLHKLEISDGNVVSVRYRGSYETLSLRNVPCLVELFIETHGKRHTSFGFPYGNLKDAFRSNSLYFSQLEHLKLYETHVKECYNVEPYQFMRLKQLTLTIDPYDLETFLVYAPLMKAAPNLEKIVIESIMVRGDSKTSAIRKAERCPHRFLKVVEFYGYLGHVMDVELILYFVENAVSLERITINPYFDTYLRMKKRRTEDEIEIEADIRLLAKRQLQGILPLQVQLEIL